MNQLTVGKYVPYNSFLHRIDARVKIAAIVVLMVALFLNFETWNTSFIMLGALSILTIILLFISRINIVSIFSSMKTMWFFILLLLIVYILMPVNNPELGILVEINNFKIYWDSLFQSFKIILRLFLMLCLTMLLTATTKPLELTYGIEWYFSPLKLIKFPAAEVAMTISIALRFIPTLLEDTTRIVKAQQSRGVNFRTKNIGKRIIALTSLIVPLFVSAFTRSEELANAMECRGYNPIDKRTRYRQLKFKISDLVVFLFCNALLAFFLFISIKGINILLLFGIEAL